MKSSKKLQISSHLLFVYINNQDRKWRMSALVFSSALAILGTYYNMVACKARMLPPIWKKNCKSCPISCGMAHFSPPNLIFNRENKWKSETR